MENRRKKDIHGHPYNLDAYSSSSMDETSYSPEMNPSMKGLNNEILNSNYSLSVSEGKGFFNSLYLLEQYQNQYQNFMSGKTPKEPPIVPYSTPNAKVPSHSGEHPHGGAKCDSAFIQSPASVASTSNGTSMMDGYLQGMYPKGLEPTQPSKPFDYGYGPYAANHNRASLNPHLNRHTLNNGHLNGHLPMQPDKAGPVPHHPTSTSSSSTQYYPKGTFDGRPVPNGGGIGDVNSRRALDQMLSTNSLYNCNSFYQEKINSGRSRSESQITSPSPVLNNKSPQLRPNGSTGNGFVKESGKFLPTERVGPPLTSSGARSSTDSVEYLSSDDDNMSSRVPPYATAVEYPKSDLNDDSNSVLSNCDARSKQGDAEMSANIGNSRNSPSAKASLNVYNFIEELRMQELTIACDTLRPWGQYQKVVGEMAQLTEMYEAAEKVITKVIEMAQMVTTFQDLCKNEQQTLLKGAVTEMVILRAVLNYIPEENTWVFNLRNVSRHYCLISQYLLLSHLTVSPSPSRLKTQTPEEGQFLKYSTYEKLICKSYVEVKQFMHSFSQDWKSDRTLFDLVGGCAQRAFIMLSHHARSVWPTNKITQLLFPLSFPFSLSLFSC